jgi:transcriptional regulator with XRE-family HTH domain
LNRNQFVKRSGLDYSSVNDWEKGDVAPRIDSLERVATATGYTVGELLGEPEAKVERESTTAVTDFLEQMGARVTPEHAAVLRSINFGGMEPTVSNIAGIWGELRAADGGRAVPAHVIEPPPLPEGARRLPKKVKK